MNNVESPSLCIHGIESTSSAGIIAQVSTSPQSKKYPKFIPTEELALRREIKDYAFQLTAKQREGFFSMMEKWGDYCVEVIEAEQAEEAAGEDI